MQLSLEQQGECNFLESFCRVATVRSTIHDKIDTDEAFHVMLESYCLGTNHEISGNSLLEICGCPTYRTSLLCLVVLNVSSARIKLIICIVALVLRHVFSSPRRAPM